jgi:hypothetical protein
MAIKKTNNYISAELEFAERSLEQWKEYIESNPIPAIEDRWGKKEMPKGGQTWVVTATAEQQIKCVQDTLKNYLALLEVVDKLREKEESKVEVRGGAAMSTKAERWLKQRNETT